MKDAPMPDIVAALARTGRLGLEHVERPPLVVPDRRVHIRDSRIAHLPLGWQLPPRIRQRLPLGTVTSDATSGVFIPQTSAEWTTFNANNGWANPDHLYLWQEASGNILDKIGSSNLTVAGAPTYAQTVSGWSTKALTFTNGTNNQRATSTAITDIATNSALCLFYANTPTTPAATRKFLSFGTGANTGSVTMTTTAAYRIDSSGNNATDTVTTENSASVKCFVLAINRTSNFVKGYCTSMAAIKTPTFASGMTGNEICWGSADNGTVATIAMNVLYGAVWVGANAEKTDQDIKSLMMQLGAGFWTPTWTVAYTGAISETDNLSESVAAVFSTVGTVSESEATSESVVAIYGATPSVSETNTTSESLASQYNAVVAPSETDTTTESIVVSIPYTGSVSESETLSESVTALYNAIIALSETDTLTEALVAGLAAAVGVSESATLAEVVAALYAAKPNLSESNAVAESLAALYAANIGLAESQALSEAVAYVFGIIKNLSESATLAEAVSAAYTAIVGITDANTLIEALLVHYATAVGLSESEALTELLVVLKGIPRRELQGVLQAHPALQGTLSALGALLGALVVKAWSGKLDRD